MCDLAEVTATYVALIQIQQWGDKCETRWQRCAKWQHPNHASAMQNGSYALLHLPSSTQQHTSFTHELHSLAQFCRHIDNIWQLTKAQRSSKFVAFHWSSTCSSLLFQDSTAKALAEKAWQDSNYNQLHGNMRNITRTYERTQFGSLAYVVLTCFDIFWHPHAFHAWSEMFPCSPMFPHVPPLQVGTLILPQ